MNAGGTITLRGYQVTITRQDRADISTSIYYFEAESESDVLRHVIRHACEPNWLEHLNPGHHMLEAWENVAELGDGELKQFFENAYDAHYQSQGDKYVVEVEEWEMPNFIKI